MQMKICHDLFPYLWECFEIGLKTSQGRITFGDSLRQAHWCKQQAITTHTPPPPPPGKQPGGAQAGHVSQQKTLFISLYSYLPWSDQVWPGYMINLDLSKRIMLREGGKTERRVRKIIQKHHVDQPGHPYEKFMSIKVCIYCCSDCPVLKWKLGYQELIHLLCLLLSQVLNWYSWHRVTFYTLKMFL